MAGHSAAAGRGISSTVSSGCRRRSSANVFSGLENRSVRRGSRFQRQRDDRRFRTARENLDDLVLRPREVGETVDDDEVAKEEG